MPDSAFRLPKRLFFKMEGDPGENGLVRAPDFIEFFEGVLRVLRNLERTTAKGAGRVTYRISGLEASSAAVELEVESSDEGNYRANVIVDRFASGASALFSGHIDRFDADQDTIRAFKALIEPLGEHVPAILFRADETEVVFSRDNEHPPGLRLESQVSDLAVGSFSGYIDAINVHREPVFFLYPPVGPTRIACEFDAHMLPDVRAALKTYVTVNGLLAYHQGNPFPARITVESISLHPPENELPTLASLRGIAPELTGGVDSVTFLRELRDAQDA